MSAPVSAERTPTPWTARDNEYFWEIGSANGLVADLVESTSMFDRKDHGEANAQFIVRAVNSHDELVAALVKYRDEFCEGWCCENSGIFDDCSGCVARAVVAKVEGQS